MHNHDLKPENLVIYESKIQLIDPEAFCKHPDTDEICCEKACHGTRGCVIRAEYIKFYQVCGTQNMLFVH